MTRTRLFALAVHYLSFEMLLKSRDNKTDSKSCAHSV